jgi:hypothetical protein
LRLARFIAAGLLIVTWANVGYAGSPSPSGDATNVDQEALLEVVAWRYGLDANLLKAIATVESARQTRVVSPAGALGLMQLMPATARRFRVGDPFDPVDNALGAARFLAYLQSQQLRSKGDANLAELLAAYNAGEGAVRRYQGVPPYAETQSYVRRVLWRYLLADEPASATDTEEMAGTGISPQRSDTSEWTKSAPNSRDSDLRGEDEALLGQLSELRHERARASRTKLSVDSPLDAGK